MNHLPLNSLLPFLDSTGLLTAVTFAIGISAYSVYRRQQRDAKRDAARIILLEIESAEESLRKIKQAQPFAEASEPDTVLMKNASWDKNKYLFVREFDRGEWDRIVDFYAGCRAYDEAVKLEGSYFHDNQRELRINAQRVLSAYAQEYAEDLAIAKKEDESRLTEAYVAKRTGFTDAYINDKPGQMYLYSPMKATNNALAALGIVERNLSLSSVGIKLKRLSSKAGPWKRLMIWVTRSKEL